MPLTRYRPQMLAVLRIMTGLLFMAHGIQKVFGFPAPFALPMNPLLWTAATLEIVGGVAIVAGFYTRYVAFVLAGMMAVAFFMAHFPRSFFPILNGGEAAVLYCFIFLYLFVAGGGMWSVDAARGKSA